MTDEMSLEQAAEWIRKLMESYLKKASELHFRPYVEQISEVAGPPLRSW
jgi:hypothetical protein